MNDTATPNQLLSQADVGVGGDSPSKNDNSNPQQGTGGSRSTADCKETAAPATENIYVMPSASFQRDTLKILPTTKDVRKLFVGGLPTDITNEEFHAFFEQFGQVMDSFVMFHRETRRSRGFGFVTFKDPAVCRYLLSVGS
jgi:hypothetical protein